MVGIGRQCDDRIEPVGIGGSAQRLFNPFFGNAQQLGHLRKGFLPDGVKPAGYNADRGQFAVDSQSLAFAIKDFTTDRLDPPDPDLVRRAHAWKDQFLRPVDRPDFLLAVCITSCLLDEVHGIARQIKPSGQCVHLDGKSYRGRCLVIRSGKPICCHFKIQFRRFNPLHDLGITLSEISFSNAKLGLAGQKLVHRGIILSGPGLCKACKGCIRAGLGLCFHCLAGTSGRQKTGYNQDGRHQESGNGIE